MYAVQKFSFEGSAAFQYMIAFVVQMQSSENQFEVKLLLIGEKYFGGSVELTKSNFIILVAFRNIFGKMRKSHFALLNWYCIMMSATISFHS